MVGFSFSGAAILARRPFTKRVLDLNIRDPYFIDRVSVLVHDDDEPTGPVPARHCRALLEIACERHRVGASGGIARRSMPL
jgi:hypothetical protein